MKPDTVFRCSATGKSTFVTLAVATSAAERMRCRGENVHAYACEACGWFHVGHIRGAPRWITEEERIATLNAITGGGRRWSDSRHKIKRYRYGR